tara:strand:- start:1279 stop:1482 length:204 start_codon:yes stop_codon:yes gene_type:complete
MENNYVVVTAIEHSRVEYIIPLSILEKGREISHAQELVNANCIHEFSSSLLTTDIVDSYVKETLVTS